MVGKQLIGVLALQGDFSAHMNALERADLATREVRTSQDLIGVSGLILPGGESTTQLKLLHSQDLFEPLKETIASGVPTFATCAGVILLAKEVRNPAQESLDIVPMVIERNSYGDQRHSFTMYKSWRGKELSLVFIRAPRIIDWDASVEPLILDADSPLLVRWENIYCTTFHPELANATDYYDLCFRQRSVSQKPSPVQRQKVHAGSSY